MEKLKSDLVGQDETALSYFYFDQQARGSINPVTVIGCLASQILSRLSDIPEAIIRIFKKANASNRPDQATLEKVFLLACAEFSTIYVVLDALDECEEKDHRRIVLHFLQTLIGRADVRLLVTSRHYPIDIQRVFSEVPQLKIEANVEDLRRFLSWTIDNDPMADIIDEEFKLRIIETIVGNAQHM